MGPRTDPKAEDPGVPEALPRTLVATRSRFAPEGMDHLWIFPPMRRGRREWGLVAVSLTLDGEERRRLVTVAYTSERTGAGLTLDQVFHDEGEAPPDFLPRIMEGVVRRAGDAFGEPRVVEIAGDAALFTALVEEFDPALLAVQAK
jgi:hypothetical protein